MTDEEFILENWRLAERMVLSGLDARQIRGQFIIRDAINSWGTLLLAPYVAHGQDFLLRFELRQDLIKILPSFSIRRGVSSAYHDGIVVELDGMDEDDLDVARSRLHRHTWIEANKDGIFTMDGKLPQPPDLPDWRPAETAPEDYYL